MSDYISVRQAMKMLGYKSPGYFRDKFLEPGNELLPTAPQPPGKRQRRRLRILRSAVEALCGR